jgi:hypothetical protein
MLAPDAIRRSTLVEISPSARYAVLLTARKALASGVVSLLTRSRLSIEPIRSNIREGRSRGLPNNFLVDRVVPFG